MELSYPTLMAVIGIALLTIEFAVFGFSTLFLVFAGLAFLITAALQGLGLVEHSILASALSVGVFSLVAGISLWKPLHALQGKQQDPNQQPNSLPNVSFDMPEDMDIDQSINYQYSGITWKLIHAKPDTSLRKGEQVNVVRTEVGKMYVERESPEQI